MNVKAVIAEFIGTFALVFVSVGVIASNHMTDGATGLTGIALAQGAIIAVMIAATMAISGAHINPAVTIGMLVTRNIDLVNALAYIFFQCIGALVAAALIKSCIPPDVLVVVGMGTPAVGSGIPVNMAFITEIILTFILVFVIFGAAVDKRGSSVTAPLAIGLAVMLGVLLGSPISGAAMNPARYLGPALLGGGLENAWLYWVGPIIGSVAAAVTYQKFLLEQ